ncbi:putative disease resistance protein RGA3 [Quercus suber]|uniref:putative disease resistance protein RGA3 n=1 Tax=Quercus suber TaxID=58331 RepID=UPI000CE24D4F|nr:putative disease resistance protein RGA3 [Quercus suber]
MAEGALFDLAGNVLQLLGSIIVEESPQSALLLDAEKQSSHSHQIKDWLSKLKDVLHDADDLLDDCSTEVMRRKVMTKKVRLSNPLAFSPKMGHEIKAIREKLNAIAKDKEAFHFIPSLDEPQVMNRGDTETYSFVLEDEVIGREDDKKEIMERLFDDNVVENIFPSFQLLVLEDWVCVSDVFVGQRIVKEILEQLTKRKHEESLEILQNQLREELNGKKYLLVLDDLWNENNNKWLLLKNLLICGARGSRILVTTRSERVARILGAAQSHALRGLPEEKAWKFFVKVAFEQGKLQENEVRISLGKEINGKCAGVPLAIRTIASLLSTKASENDWRYFRSCLLLEITQEEEKENDILSTLKLSYDHLPSYLKQCFAYCRLFPKDYEIRVTTLINLWTAQGFIKLSNSKRRVEDVGREYFMVLLWRWFFQDVKKDEYNNILYCKMHDLMHDLATLVAGRESIVLTSSGEYNGKKVHHVSFDLEDSSRKLSIFKVKGMKIRTVLAASVGGKLGNLTCNALISNLNYLRMLNLSCLGLHVVPHSIGELNHLRYLDLSGNEHIVVLPNSITKLLNLQTLKLYSCKSLKELPWGLKKLVNLRHLDVRRCDKLTHMPLGLGQFTSLEILPLFVVWQEGSKASSGIWSKKKQARFGGGLSELKELSNLGGSLFIRKLGHGEDDMVECKATNMKQKQHLQELRLRWDDGETECYDEMSLEGLFQISKRWNCSFIWV